MTPNQLEKRLAELYGASLSRWGLCKALALDTGLHPDAVQKWLNGVNTISPLVPLAIEALEARKSG